MKLIDLINKMYKRDIEIGFQFTLHYKEFTLNTYEVRECSYGLMIWDLDSDSRFDSSEYILDYLDWNVESIKEDKEIEEISADVVRSHYFTGADEIIADKLNEVIKELNKIKKEGK